MQELTSLNIALDIIFLQETWLSDSQIPPFFDIEGYTIVKQAKHASEHGGLLLYINKTISFTEIHLPKHRSWENQFINLRIGSQSIILGNVYRPPHKTISELENFNEEFNAIVHKQLSSKI
jgi:exonuclease III